MPKHTVSLSVKVPEISKIDSIFETKADGAKVGTLKIPKGGIDYTPVNKQKPTKKMKWVEFHKLMSED